mmetsp:Transcript_9216/g.26325  ORF Transcript_9216/g.26325 Transcript_9216/m.26325 type:complete len:350 (-) Transcript_9216:5467-6516(-)
MKFITATATAFVTIATTAIDHQAVVVSAFQQQPGFGLATAAAASRRGPSSASASASAGRGSALFAAEPSPNKSILDEAAAAAAPSIAEATAATATITETVKDVQQKIANKMDERIFTFNKVVIDTVYELICFFYPVRGTERDFARFFVLETVARVPYFAYLSVMHLRETFGERDLGDKMRTHYAEADNELHHLLIMESLGGNKSVVDRVLAQTMAFFYYWYVVLVYAWSEDAAYHLSELIEDHAFNTYSKYLEEHEEMLKSMPVPDVARKYYVDDNPFLFDLFCTVKEVDEDGNFSARRPQLESLYDVFVNVRDDEKEHWKTLCNLVQYGDMQGCASSMVKPTEPRPAE